MENGHRNSGFSHEKWGFSIAMLVHQRVTNQFLRVATIDSQLGEQLPCPTTGAPGVPCCFLKTAEEEFHRQQLEMQRKRTGQSDWCGQGVWIIFGGYTWISMAGINQLLGRVYMIEYVAFFYI